MIEDRETFPTALMNYCMVYGIYLFLCLAGLFCCAAEADVYHWEDNRGHVYYSDKVPPEHTRYRRTQKNKKGRTIRIHERAMTEQEIQRERALQKLRAEEKRLLAEQRAHDRALLHTFASEAEIETAFQRKLQTMDGLIKVTEAVIGRLDAQLVEQQKRAAALDRDGKTISKRLIESIQATQRQIADSRKKIDSQNHEKQRLHDRFAQDVERFRNLTGTGDTLNAAGHWQQKPASDSAAKEQPDIVGLMTCSNSVRCDMAWTLARQYVEKHASAGLQINTDHILMSADPKNENDISLTVSRIPVRPTGAQLFLSVRCKQSSLGQELCAGSEAHRILSGFRPYIEAGMNSAS